MAVMHSRDDLPEEVSGLALRDLLGLADVVVQVTPTRVLHHNDYFVFVFKHCSKRNVH